jgi:hypothetical protein
MRGLVLSVLILGAVAATGATIGAGIGHAWTVAYWSAISGVLFLGGIIWIDHAAAERSRRTRAQTWARRDYEAGIR